MNELRASYTDTFEHAFDAKGRITVPTEWRAPSFETRLVAFPSSEACVKIYPESYLSDKQREMAGMPINDPRRRKIEALAAMAQNVSWDPQGRITIKERLRTKAGLKKSSTLVGKLDHFEIWDRDAYSKLAESNLTLEGVMESLGL